MEQLSFVEEHRGIKREAEIPTDAQPLNSEKRPRNKEHPMSRNCPYLDTINRLVASYDSRGCRKKLCLLHPVTFFLHSAVLDFDFEKLCSVSLSHLNVYACLVCGRYFQGRGNNTHAYTHSVEQSHHVFLNLSESLKFYCLPDGYEIVALTLEDITVCCMPSQVYRSRGLAAVLMIVRLRLNPYVRFSGKLGYLMLSMNRKAKICGEGSLKVNSAFCESSRQKKVDPLE